MRKISNGQPLRLYLERPEIDTTIPQSCNCSKIENHPTNKHNKLAANKEGTGLPCNQGLVSLILSFIITHRTHRKLLGGY